jgi:hypothetical protein
MTTIPTTAPANAQRLTVRAEKTLTVDGQEGWQLVDNGGNTLDGFIYRDQEAAMNAARQMWPAYFPWFGQEDGDGWSIVVS